MKLIIKIAWRNLFRHKAKSLVIGGILFVGALLMTVGNGVTSGMDRGLEKTIVESFTGDIVIIPEKQESDNVFLSMMGKSIEPLNNYKEIKAALENNSEIAGMLPVGKNAAMALNDKEGNPGFAFLLGVNWQEFNKFFPDNFKYLEGKEIRENDRAVLVPTKMREDFNSFSGIWLTAEGDSVHTANLSEDAKKNINSLIYEDYAIFMGMNDKNSTADIKLPVRGIVKYKALNHILGHFIIMDIESYRECLGYFSAQDIVEVADDKKAVLESENLDDMFASEDMFVKSGSTETNSLSAGDLKIDTEQRTLSSSADLDNGTFNMVLVMLKDHSNLDKKTAEINKILKDKGLSARAVTWKKAMGVMGSMAALIKSALFIFVMMLFVVAIIIIVNTLSMAALERTTEIGMMRAVGARKGFISKMFFAETAALSAVFGGAGIVAGAITVKILAAFNFTSDNDMVQLFFGGDTFHPLLTGTDFVLALIQLTLVTLIAVIYPLRVARSITPLDAISRD
ncbi:MAG: ABC transporter permease [Fibrobacteres bacterium]|nr:ABC transporter permease [Fibrobacterota bacterium]